LTDCCGDQERPRTSRARKDARERPVPTKTMKDSKLDCGDLWNKNLHLSNHQQSAGLSTAPPPPSPLLPSPCHSPPRLHCLATLSLRQLTSSSFPPYPPPSLRNIHRRIYLPNKIQEMHFSEHHLKNSHSLLPLLLLLLPLQWKRKRKVKKWNTSVELTECNPNTQRS
jgi:hypothetical protein